MFFHGLTAHFFFVLNNVIPFYVCNTVYLSIHPLKGSLVALAIINKDAINIHMKVFVRT